ncbi:MULTISPECIES: hypothetical protein [Methylorubrum]|uniref:hypothetical protein n=1 Tax=Methylorubrum TaxID=2282523 RepID=UPI0020A068F5|nr:MULTISPECIES: hypothetical protein [Methylorubrum]MCP1548586.1 hypothetical protein [Methylorubrum zatmanii]MCP1554800.1 hypothetical protein [Methylorubrum extorquens]MCP1578889.1 hypothetical protein [Methylorubrum extorquens]
MPALDLRRIDDRPTPRPSCQEVIVVILLLAWIAAILATEHGPAQLAPPLVPYGAADATASSAAMSPPPIRGR